MVTTTGKVHCITCRKENAAYRCKGCSQNFCVNHLSDHQHAFGKQFDEVEDRRTLFRETFNQQKRNSPNYSLTQSIDKWEQQSIETIQQTAAEARQLLIQFTTECINGMEVKLNKLTKQVRQTREEKNINENIVNQFKQKTKRTRR